MTTTPGTDMLEVYIDSLPETTSVIDAALGFRVVESVQSGRTLDDVRCISQRLIDEGRFLGLNSDVGGNEGVVFAIIASVRDTQPGVEA